MPEPIKGKGGDNSERGSSEVRSAHISVFQYSKFSFLLE